MSRRNDIIHTAASERTPLDELTAGAERHPDRDLLVFDDVDVGVSRFSWREVLEATWAMADRLASAGLGRNQRLHIHLSNRPEFLFAWFACSALGATIVPTNVQSSADEIAYVLEHSDARLSLTDGLGSSVVSRAARGLHRPHQIELTDDAAGAGGVSVLPNRLPDTPDLDLGLIYTSGTTARPKGVRITNANYVYAGEVFARNTGLGSGDRVLTVLPLFHANAQYYTVMGALVSRATIVLASRFSATRLLGQIITHDVTVASLFAAPIRMVLAQPTNTNRFSFPRLRLVVFAQNISTVEKARWDEVVGAPLVQLYGMTETVGPPLINPLDGRARPDSLGRVALGYVCRVIREDGRPAMVGEIGQLCVQGVPGQTIMRGYLDDDDATNEMVRDGWLHTGDVVRVEPDGWFSFVDRRKDMIKRGGENVATTEVETVLRAHPAVRDAAVFGVPDPIRDEDIIAAVVLAPDSPDTSSSELIAWCAFRLAKFRVPSRVLLLDELPRTAVGKIQKHLLLEQVVRSAGQTRAT
jgi:crotonobetaine/carnitine-CoA ligase